VPLTLPFGRRPSSAVYIPIDLCSGHKGRLHITTDGVVEVQPEAGNVAAAQCFTSLDGVAFEIDTGGSTVLSLTPPWTNSGYVSRPAAARVSNGIVRLQGAIGGGTTTSPFTLPSGFRPNATTYVPVDLCNAAQGRLKITSGGIVTVETLGSSGDAWCFTSLEGVSFAVNTVGFESLTLQNGWSALGGGTRSPMAKNVNGVVRLVGAIKTSGTTPTAFTLPAKMAPATTVYVPITLCNGAKGRLSIAPSGNVGVHTPPSGQWASAQCGTSLEGASFGL
jgi:hypothetical protein